MADGMASPFRDLVLKIMFNLSREYGATRVFELDKHHYDCYNL